MLQHGLLSRSWMFAVSDVPVLQDHLDSAARHHPACGTGMQAASIRRWSVITSLVAGSFFLPQPWKRAVLCLAVIPLALVRNAFRIFVSANFARTHRGRK